MRLAVVAVGAVGIAGGGGWLLWTKRPIATDLAKLCRVQELSGCTDEPSPFTECETDWLKQRLWTMAIVDEVMTAPIVDGERRFADNLRKRAADTAMGACPLAERWERAGDANTLCEAETFDRCLRADASATDCAQIDLRSPGGRAARDALVATKSVSERSDFIDSFVTKNRHGHYCPSLDRLVELDRKQAMQTEVDPYRSQPVEIRVFDIQGRHSALFLQDVLQTGQANMQECYQAKLQRNGVEGQALKFRLSFAAGGGSPTAVDVDESQWVNDELAACAQKALRGVILPRSPLRGPMVASVTVFPPERAHRREADH